ncbi:MAG TPA: 50S ribosomal protein L29 [Gammaproteobacteria bacterium]|jgi:large subunit ribosomal protein L29|nr:50S ribosomal protein L29 [Gammaproteobacteria bacterium]
MKASELREKTIVELNEELISVRQEQFNLRMQQASGQTPRPDQITLARKNVARILTIVKEKQLEGNKA